MAGLTRKNLVVDAGKLRQLAQRRGTSESAAVRDAVDFVLAAEEAVEIFRELQARGGVDDVFGKFPEASDDKAEPAGTKRVTRRASRRPAAG